jgi:soluble cytochrome b562
MRQVSFGRSGFALAALGAAFVSVAALAQPGSGKAPKNPTNAHDTMEAMDEQLGKLERDLGKPEALKTVWEIERLALQARTMTPEHLKGGATAENLLAYRKAHLDVMKLLLQLEGNVLDNKVDQAKHTLEQIDEAENAAHRKYRTKREGR